MIVMCQVSASTISCHEEIQPDQLIAAVSLFDKDLMASLNFPFAAMKLLMIYQASHSQQRLL